MYFIIFFFLFILIEFFLNYENFKKAFVIDFVFYLMGQGLFFGFLVFLFIVNSF